MTRPKLTVIVPLYNEEQTVAHLLKKIEASAIEADKEIVVVNDGSTDQSEDAVLKSGVAVKYYKHQHNRGRGAAIKTALTNSYGDYVVFQDADLEYDPADFQKMLKPLVSDNIDLTIGSRALSGSIKLWGRGGVSLLTYVAWVGITFLVNVFYGRQGTDYYGCYKMFRRSVIASVPVKSNGFAYDMELLCKVFRRDFKTTEVAISYSPRQRKDGKKVLWRDGFAAVWAILKYKFKD